VGVRSRSWARVPSQCLPFSETGRSAAQLCLWPYCAAQRIVADGAPMVDMFDDGAGRCRALCLESRITCAHSPLRGRRVSDEASAATEADIGNSSSTSRWPQALKPRPSRRRSATLRSTPQRDRRAVPPAPRRVPPSQGLARRVGAAAWAAICRCDAGPPARAAECKLASSDGSRCPLARRHGVRPPQTVGRPATDAVPARPFIAHACQARQPRGSGEFRVRRETGKEQRVQVPHSKGIANHAVPESCAGHREVHGEALTGVRAGQPLSRVRNSIRVPTLSDLRKATRKGASSQALLRPGVVVDPGMRARSLHGNREISSLTAGASCGRRPASGR
jgi:hypothetical protein